MTISKELLLERLRKDSLYNDALKMARSDSERAHIVNVTENILSGLSELLTPFVDMMSNSNQQDIKQILEDHQLGKQLFNEGGELALTGTIGSSNGDKHG